MSDNVSPQVRMTRAIEREMLLLDASIARLDAIAMDANDNAPEAREAIDNALFHLRDTQDNLRDALAEI